MSTEKTIASLKRANAAVSAAERDKLVDALRNLAEAVESAVDTNVQALRIAREVLAAMPVGETR